MVRSVTVLEYRVSLPSPGGYQYGSDREDITVWCGAPADAGFNTLQYHMVDMELEAPQTIACPLCSPFNEHEVQLKENKNGKPYFTCRAPTGNATVNLNGKESIQMLRAYTKDDDSGDDSDSDSESLGEADEPDDDQSLEDILGGDDD